MYRTFRIMTPVIAAGCVAVAAPAFGQLQFQDQTSTRFPSQFEYTNQISIVDFDNDGDLDIALANGQGFSTQGAALKLRLYVNDGSGVFTDETDARTGGWAGWARGVEFGDVDRDGDWDMIIAQDFNKRPVLMINGLGGPKGDQLGYFTNEPNRLPALALSSARAQFGDVDNDGDLDLVLCHSGPNNRFGTGAPKLYLNDGTGFFTDATATHLPSNTTTDQQDVIMGDVDGDFDLDFHLGSRAGQSKLYINDGSGVYSILPGFPGGANAYSYDFGDIDDDGDLDLLAANGGAELLLRNTNNGTTWVNISSEISPNSGIDDNDSKFFDFDNDGDLDFIIGSLGSQERIYRNNGSLPTADFTQVTGAITVVADATLDIEVADVTGDNKLDIITAQGESGNFQDRIYVNIGPDSVADSIAPKVIATEQVSEDAGNGPFVIRTIVYDGVSSDRGFYDNGVFLKYSVKGGPEQEVQMLWSGNSLWRGVLPAQPDGSTVTYHVAAADRAGNVGLGEVLNFTVKGKGGSCGADVDQSGSVDVVDLLAIINAWGSSDPQYDIAPPGGDGTVNVADLLAVITAWGPCK